MSPTEVRKHLRANGLSIRVGECDDMPEIFYWEIIDQDGHEFASGYDGENEEEAKAAAMEYVTKYLEEDEDEKHSSLAES